MSIIPKLANSLNSRDEIPNQELAADIVKRGDTAAVAELAGHFANKNKGIRHDCIKVLYEVGHSEPKMIAPHLPIFLELLKSKDNRLQWGAMTALGCIARERPEVIFAELSAIVDAADSGSVITRDHCVNILITLSSIDRYAGTAFPLLLEQMMKCPTNQLPMYAENAMPIVKGLYCDQFCQVLTSRLNEIEKESKKRRVEKAIVRVRKAAATA